MATKKRKRINKERLSAEERREQDRSARLREALNGVKLDYVFTFGRYKGDMLKYVIGIDHTYVEWVHNKKVLTLSSEVLEYLLKVKHEAQDDREHDYEQQAERERKAREHKARQAREQEARRRTRARERQRQQTRSAYQDWSGTDFENILHDFVRNNDPFGHRRRTHHSQQRTQYSPPAPSPTIVSPANQWDHLSERKKAAAILGVTGQVTKEEIRQLYKKKMLEYHPDKACNLGTEMQKLAHEMSIKINEAYEYFKSAYGI